MAEQEVEVELVTVGQLKKVLAGYPNDRPVVLSRDAEGNGFSPLATIDDAMYYPEEPSSGEAYATPEEIADPESAYTEEDEAPEGSIRVLLLGPVN